MGNTGNPGGTVHTYGVSAGISDEDLAEFRRLVDHLRELPADDPGRRQAEQLAKKLTHDGKSQRRRMHRAALRAADTELLATTATGAPDRREDAPLTSEGHEGSVGELARGWHCYTCKRPYRQVDAFYHRLCPDCAVENRAKRELSTDLRGRRALLTGGRVKIGFQLALMMLRDGAELLVTSRFPHDTMRRFRAVPDSSTWLDRLTVLAVDLRDPRQVLGLCEELRASGEPLDILVNNAAQTIRRPAASYAALAAGERAELPAG
ncbi:SDR family NAD(P)-dependent oxidoreductase, partial [Streptomyces sp. T-3]|nr:SDR family NAD(P)-dependent oxidoreductase [Streptomyces sp. T-3]